jgi:hypothetical protein
VLLSLCERQGRFAVMYVQESSDYYIMSLRIWVDRRHSKYSASTGLPPISHIENLCGIFWGGSVCPIEYNRREHRSFPTLGYKDWLVSWFTLFHESFSAGEASCHDMKSSNSPSVRNIDSRLTPVNNEALLFTTSELGHR